MSPNKTKELADPRLPATSGTWLFRPPVGGLWLGPSFDWTALKTITRVLMPLARAGAAATMAGGDRGRFWQELPGTATDRLPTERTLAAVGGCAVAYEDADRRWRAAFFGEEPTDAAHRVQAELRRRAAIRRVERAQLGLLPLVLRGRVAALRWDVRSVSEAKARHEARLASPETAFPAPSVPEVSRSRGITGPYGDEQYWLRFPAPVAETGNDAWAHVYAPHGVKDPPTFIFLHGVLVEPEFVPDAWDPLPRAVREGVRVIRPEGPWHGRRRLGGRYGGEPVLARGPLGFLDFFAGWVAEIAALVAWARRTGRGPVAVGGISIGALTTQLVATAARHWPAEMTPDAFLLVATSDEIADAGLNGSLGRALGLPRQLAANGWSEEALAEWAPLTEPRGQPAVPAEHIVMAIGSRDTVLPPRGAFSLADRWSVPQENLFVSRCGHFSMSLGLGVNHAPLRKVLTLLQGR
ncbi:MAG: hypothetical protein ACE5Q3_13245 [Alphaproteobacteria bacterium]